jgi:hypothetical protein
MGSTAEATVTAGACLPVARTRVGLTDRVERQHGGERACAAPFDWTSVNGDKAAVSRDQMSI